MFIVIGYVIRIIASVIIGLTFGMSIKGIILLALVVMIAMEIISLVTLPIFGPFFTAVSVVLQIIVVVIILINYSLVPNIEERYIPDAGIAASLDGRQSINLRDINVDEPFYLQIKLAIQSKSWARNFFGRNDIEVMLEISNPSISVFSEPQNVQFVRETRPKQVEPDKVTYFYSIVASGSRNPKTSIIDFKVTPTQAGSQVIKITYDNKVSDIHTRTVTLEYK